MLICPSPCKLSTYKISQAHLTLMLSGACYADVPPYVKSVLDTELGSYIYKIHALSLSYIPKPTEDSESTTVASATPELQTTFCHSQRLQVLELKDIGLHSD